MDLVAKDAVKAMVELSETWQEADKVIKEFTPWKSTGERLSYLYGTFNVSILASHDGIEDEQHKLEADYRAVLSAIVNQKWR